MNKMTKMYLITTLVMLIWGLNLPLLKYILQSVDPITMTAFRLFVAALSVFIILALLKVVRLPHSFEWKYIIGGSLFNVVMHHYFLNMGLERTSGVNAGLILGTGPVLTAVLTGLILKILPTRMQWIGVVFGFVGVSSVVFASGGELTGLSLGDVFVFLAILAQVLSFLIIAKAAKTLDPRLLTGYMLLVGSIIMLLISLVQEPDGIPQLFAQTNPYFWLAFFASGIIGTAVGHMLYNAAVGEIGPTKAAIFINLNTLFSLTGSALLLGEQLTIRHFFAFLLILIGVLFGSGALEDLIKRNKNVIKER